MAQNVLLDMTRHTDGRAFKRWNSMLELDQVKRLMDKYDCGANVSKTPTTRKTPQPSVAPGKKGGKSSKSSKGSQPT